MVGHEVTNIEGQLQNTAVVILSNQSSHGWYSAIPSCKKYIEKKRQSLEPEGKHYRHTFFIATEVPLIFGLVLSSLMN